MSSFSGSRSSAGWLAGLASDGGVCGRRRRAVVDPAIPFGADLRRGGPGQQADHDEGDQAADQPGEDRFVGVDVAVDGHGAQGEHGAGGDADQRAGDGAALPDHPADDRDQQAADQDVVGDGEGGDDVTEDAGDGDHDDAEGQDVPPAVADLVVLLGRGQLLAAGRDRAWARRAWRSRVPTMSSLATVAVAISAPLEVDMMAASAAATTRPATPCGSTSVTMAG